MFEMFDTILGRFRSIWEGMTLNQRVVSVTVIAALLVSSLFLSTISEKIQDYTVLFAQLDASSASAIITRLEQQGVDYRLAQNGTAIEVPSSQADQLKIQLVAEGLPESGIVGYEILDTTNFGMSDFMQNLNYKRALEGEIMRTLRTLEEVKEARVHLVIPEPSLFTEEAQSPTATVVLDLRQNRSLPAPKVEAIANLVASAAVEGLSPENVTIVDTKGNQLSQPVMDELARQSSTKMDLKFNYERMMAEKVTTLINGAFGRGKALVTVNADLDFDSIERETIAYDQDASAIASEQRREVTNPTGEGGGGGEEETITNYETGSVVERLIRTPGSDIKRLSVSVMIDGKEVESQDEEGNTIVDKVPWSAEEMANIQAITESAVGYNAERGDRVEVVNMTFDVPDLMGDGGGITIRAAIIEGVSAVATSVAIIVALWLFYMMIRAIVNSLDPANIKIKAEEEFKKIMPSLEEEDETPSERAELIRKIIQKSSVDAELAAKTIKSIYRNEP